MVGGFGGGRIVQSTRSNAMNGVIVTFSFLQSRFQM